MLLHEDILVPVGNTSLPSVASVNELRNISNDFISQVSLLSFTGSGKKDFTEHEEAYLNACPYSHMR